MKAKKVLSVMLCAAMTFTSVPGMSAAAVNTSKTESATAETKALEKAIKDVKKRVDIPAELDDFDYKSKTEYGITYYNFEWKRWDKLDEGYSAVVESISVSYVSNGIITGYSYYNYYEEKEQKKRFSKMSAAEQDKLPAKYLKMLNPQITEMPEIKRTSPENQVDGSTVNYEISRSRDGIYLNKNGGMIQIDRHTGKLMGFSFAWWTDAEFPDAKKRLSVEKISEIYASKKPLKAYYDMFTKSEWDEEKQRYIYTDFVLPVYAPTVDGENILDAITGEYTSYFEDREKYSYTDAYDWTGYYDDEVDAGEGWDVEEECAEEVEEGAALTEAEMKALEQENSYISAKEATAIVKKDGFIVFNDNLIEKSSKIRSYTDDKGVSHPSRVMEYRYSSSKDTEDNIGLTVVLDAENGKIISFNKWYDYGLKSENRNTAPVSASKAEKRAIEAAKHFIGNKAAEYKADDFEPSKKAVSVAVPFTRYVNGLPVVFDTMSIIVDSRGEVLSFSHNYTDTQFPEAKLVGEKAAYKKLFENMKPSLDYMGFTDLQLKSHIYLSYTFDDYYLINALTGERIRTYDAVPYYTEAKISDDKEAKLYTDIKGHKYEKEITTLFNFDIRITDEAKLNPDEGITIKEFFCLINELGNDYYHIDNIYPDKRVYSKKEGRYIYEENPMVNEKLTQKELAKIYVYLMTDYYRAANLEGIFRSPYSDVKENDPYCGYIAIAKASDGLVFVKGKRFNPDKQFTRAECLKKVYDYFNTDKILDTEDIFRIE